MAAAARHQKDQQQQRDGAPNQKVAAIFRPTPIHLRSRSASKPIELCFQTVHPVVDGAELVLIILNHEGACGRGSEHTDDADSGQHQQDRNQTPLGRDRIDVAVPDRRGRRDGPPHRIAEGRHRFVLRTLDNKKAGGAKQHDAGRQYQHVMELPMP